MGWLRALIFGDVGLRLDLDDTERDIGALRQRLLRKARTDHAQDERLAALERENAQLLVFASSLSRLLVDRGVLTAEELAALVERSEGGAADPPGSSGGG